MAGGDPMRRGACNVDLCAASATVQNRWSVLLWGSGAKVDQRTGGDSAEAAAKHAHSPAGSGLSQRHTLAIDVATVAVWCPDPKGISGSDTES
jgi:hypothetical protein